MSRANSGTGRAGREDSFFVWTQYFGAARAAREVRKGRGHTRQVSEPSSILSPTPPPPKKALNAKKKTGQIFHSPLQFCILMDYKHTEKVARAVQ